jgi:hypothetical protein
MKATLEEEDQQVRRRGMSNERKEGKGEGGREGGRG